MVVVAINNFSSAASLTDLADANGNRSTQRYDKICLCLGARPKLISSHPNIIGLRDQHSVEDLLARLRAARKVVVVGNGGIALELIHEVLHILFTCIYPPPVGLLFYLLTL